MQAGKVPIEPQHAQRNENVGTPTFWQHNARARQTAGQALAVYVRMCRHRGGTITHLPVTKKAVETAGLRCPPEIPAVA